MPDVTTRADELFQRAVEVPAADRPAFLTLACEGDGALLHEVNRLLAAFAWRDDLAGRPVR